MDESSWLVIKGRAILYWLRTDGKKHLQTVATRGWALLGMAGARTRSLGKDSSKWAENEVAASRRRLGARLDLMESRGRFNLRRFGLAFRWGRIPKPWEMAFIDRMRAAQNRGVPFQEVLRETLPRMMGVDGTRILGYWAGRRAMIDPETFVRETAKLFGKSSEQVVTQVFDGLDEGKILADSIPEEPKYQSLVDAISRADEQKKALHEMRVRRTTAIVLIKGQEDF